jgi:tetratricopeptide (TPR) repeat protein
MSADRGRAVATVSTPDPSLDPLTQARRDREAVEQFRQMQSGLPAALFRTADGPPTGRAAASRRQTMAAERHRQRGTQLLIEGRLSAAISALRRATDLDPSDAGSHHMLGRAFLYSGRFAEAGANLRLAVTLDDELAAAHLDLAVALDRQGLDLEAMAAYRQAVRLAPEWAEGHGRLAELLEATGDVEGAIEAFRRAAPETPAGRLNAVRALTLEGKYREAEAQLRQAIVLDPGSDLLHKALGDALSKQGRFEEAIEACDRALTINPLQVPAHLIAVQARKCTEADRSRLDRMLSALGEASLDDEDRLFLHYAIGKMLDDFGEYREAMRHFDQANGIRRRNASFDRELFSGHVDWVMRRFTPTYFAAHADFAVDDETPLLIVGMPRSGTTLVEQILSSHPQIAGGGELVFWTRRAASWGVSSATYLTSASAHHMAGDYLAMLRRIGPSAARVTDKVPFNLFQLGLIHLLLPKARIIHCRRHPIDTCLSMYFTNFKEKFEFVSDKGDLAFAYRQYARLMDHWREVLPSDRFVEVDYESLIADRQTLTRRLIAFTGLDWHDACLAPERNKRTVITSSVWQVRQPVYATSIARWRHYEPWLGELRQLLPADEDARGAGDRPGAHAGVRGLAAARD